jgi:hypothetical protein
MRLPWRFALRLPMKQPLLTDYIATELRHFETRRTRIVQGRRPNDHGRGLGFRFESLSPLSRLMIHGVPPHLPQREPRIDYAATVGKILAA